MELTSAFIIYLTLFRLAIITASVLSIVLGYRLFVKGVWPETEIGGGTAVDAKIAGSHFTLKNAAPGTCFALFGVIILSVMFASGSPKLMLNMIRNANQFENQTKEAQSIKDSGTGELSLEIRGDESDGLKSKTEQGIFYEQQRDTANAINAYKQALATMAAPMNHLAWLYQAQGKVDEALRLSSLAVQLSNDNADFLDTLAEIQYKRGEYAEALKLMQRAARLNSKYQNKLARFRIAVKK